MDNFDPLCNVCGVDYAEQKPDGTFYRTCSSEKCIDYPQHYLHEVTPCKLCSKPCYGTFIFCSKICENTFQQEIIKKRRNQCKVCGKPSNEKLTYTSHYNVCSMKCRIISDFHCHDCGHMCAYSTHGLCDH